MTATTKANSPHIDANDPLLWFNPEALGIKPEATPQDNAPKAKGFEKSSPQSKLQYTMSGEKRTSYTASGIIKGDGIVGGPAPLISNDARSKALAHNAHLDTKSNHWQLNLSENRVNQGWNNRHLQGKYYARVNSESGDRLAEKKADPNGPKMPTFELRPNGFGQFESPLSIARPREFVLVQTKTDDKK